MASGVLSRHDLEAAIPWSQLGVTTPAAGMALRLEVAASDTDGAEPRQETMMTSSTAPWEIKRGRLLAAVWGDTSGRAVDSVSGKPLFGELELKNGECATNIVTLAALPTDREVVLALKARMQFNTPAGHTPALQVRVNGRVVNAARLVNKPQFGALPPHFLAMFALAVTASALGGSGLPRTDMDFLRDMTRDVVEASRVKPGSHGGGRWPITNSCGFTLVTPG